MREGWNTYKLGSFCDFQGGSQPPKGEWIKSPKEGYVRMLQIRDFTKSRDFDIEYVRITDKLRLCKKDDILIGRYGASVGKILTGLAGAYNVAIIKTIPDESIVCKPFLRRVLEAPGFQELLGKVSTQRTAQAGFSKEDIADYEVSLPSLPEQQRIVDILDQEFAKIDALKANAEKSLQAAKDLFQATLKKELEPKEGWETNTLSSIGKTATGTTPSTSHKEYYGDFIPFIKPADINIDGEGGLCYSNEGLSEEGANNGRVFQENSILMVCIGASIGKVGYALCPVSSNQQINILTPSKEYHWKFLYYCMASPDFQHKVIKEGESAKATLPIINKSKWERLTISTPNFTEQERIIAHLDDLNNRCNILQENYQKTLTLCDDLKQALLRKAFNGEL